MFHHFRCILSAVALSLMVFPIPCEAYIRSIKVPLTAHRGHPGARGKVIFTESFGETDQADGDKLIIEVSNVPLRPGTELVVEVNERPVGTLKLDEDRNGRLELLSKSGKSVPRIHAGSMITVSLPAGGGTVLW